MAIVIIAMITKMMKEYFCPYLISFHNRNDTSACLSPPLLAPGARATRVPVRHVLGEDDWPGPPSAEPGEDALAGQQPLDDGASEPGGAEPGWATHAHAQLPQALADDRPRQERTE